MMNKKKDDYFEKDAILSAEILQQQSSYPILRIIAKIPYMSYEVFFMSWYDNSTYEIITSVGNPQGCKIHRSHPLRASQILKDCNHDHSYVYSMLSDRMSESFDNTRQLISDLFKFDTLRTDEKFDDTVEKFVNTTLIYIRNHEGMVEK